MTIPIASISRKRKNLMTSVLSVIEKKKSVISCGTFIIANKAPIAATGASVNSKPPMNAILPLKIVHTCVKVSSFYTNMPTIMP